MDAACLQAATLDINIGISIALLVPNSPSQLVTAACTLSSQEPTCSLRTVYNNNASTSVLAQVNRQADPYSFFVQSTLPAGVKIKWALSISYPGIFLDIEIAAILDTFLAPFSGSGRWGAIFYDVVSCACGALTALLRFTAQ